MNLCICTNDRRQLQNMREKLDSFPLASTCCIYAFDRRQSLLTFAQSKRIDILVMDVHFDGHCGIRYADKLYRLHDAMQVIFLCESHQNRSLVYETTHIFALDKPIDEQLLLRAVQKAIENVNLHKSSQRRTRLVLKHKNNQHVIDCADLIYIESHLRKLYFHTVDGGIFETYLSLSEVEKQLDERFIRCHNSFIVNMDYILTYEKRKRLILRGTDPIVIPISQSRAQITNQAFMRYVDREMISFPQEAKSVES